MHGTTTPPTTLRRVPSRFRALWWMSPTAITLCLSVPVAIAVHSYRPKYIEVDRIAFGGFMLVLCLLGLAVFALSALLASLSSRQRVGGEYSIRPGCLDAIAGISIFAYAVWFRDVLVDPHLVLAVLTGTRTNLRDDIATVPGITTLVQFGVCYSVLYSINITSGEKVPLRHHLLFALLAVLSVFRSLMWSERLAVIEYLLPAVFFFCARYNRPGRRVVRFLLLCAPYLFMILSFIVFSAGEYFRSWKFFSDGNVAFLTFMFDRWIDYYFTSLNNGAFLVSYYINNIPDFHFLHILNWFYQLPGIGPWLTSAMDVTFDPEKFVLQKYLNVEFNVFSAIFPIFFDLGIVAGLVFLMVAGFFYGTMYVGFAARRGLGLIIYPTLFVSLLEILRINYFFSTRYVYILVACLIAYLFRKPLASARYAAAPAAPADAAATAAKGGKFGRPAAAGFSKRLRPSFSVLVSAPRAERGR